jgi:NitT/TauT family transport system substrate-binding protein
MISYPGALRRPAILLVIALLTAIAMRSPERPAPLAEVTLAVATHAMSALVYVALDQGYFAEEGLDIHVRPTGLGKAALAEMMQGRAEVATVAEVPVMRAVLDHQPIRVFASIEESSDDLAIVARIDSGVARPADLAGRRVGYIAGTTSASFLDVFLRAEGVAAARVERVALELADALPALREGRIDALSCWTNLRWQAEAEIPGQTVTLSAPGLYEETWDLAARPEFIRERPAVVIKILRALLAAERFVEAKPEASRAIVARALRADEAELARYWDGFVFGVRLDQSLLVNLEEAARGEQGAEAASAALNFLAALDLDGLSAVAPERITVFH